MGDDTLWGVNRRRKGAANTLAALKYRSSRGSRSAPRCCASSCATAFGLLLNAAPWREADVRSFRPRLSAEHWFKDEHLATQAIAIVQLRVLRDCLRVFAVEVRYPRLAFGCELAGMTLLAASAFALLLLL